MIANIFKHEYPIKNNRYKINIVNLNKDLMPYQPKRSPISPP